MWSKLQRELIARANVDPDSTVAFDVHGEHGPLAQEFREIFDALAHIRDHKTLGYGLSRLRVVEEPKDFDLKMLFSDLHRKHIRLRELCWKDYDQADLDALMEALGDLAVYSVMGIQIVNQLRNLEE